MRRRAGLWRLLAVCLALGTGTGAIAKPTVAAPVQASKPSLSGCQTVQGSVHFDFEGASRSTCYVENERTISLLISPEHLPPINPSPWYAFRYNAAQGSTLTVNLRYTGVRHRYAPKWRGNGDPSTLAVSVAKDGNTASITLPSGEGFVSSQPLMTSAHYEKLLGKLSDNGSGNRVPLGYSHDGRPIEAVRLGNSDAPRLLILIGRQHPPEVTGAMAMDAFVLKLAELVRAGIIDKTQYQFLIVPLLNPDGVARGHWRANLGGMDLNRDWGLFTQPETRAVADWLSRLASEIRPVLMLDFHSTNRNLFYVQGQEASDQGKAFLARWLVGKEESFEGYPFAIERRDANPGAGTTKNWFNAKYAIPAYTYEVSDEADAAPIRKAAEQLAEQVVPALDQALADVQTP